MRAFAGMALPLMLAGSQCAAAGGSDQARDARISLSNFDYVVLASLADSQWPIPLAMYQPSEVAVELREH